MDEMTANPLTNLLYGFGLLNFNPGGCAIGADSASISLHEVVAGPGFSPSVRLGCAQPACAARCHLRRNHPLCRSCFPGPGTAFLDAAAARVLQLLPGMHANDGAWARGGLGWGACRAA